MDEILRKMLRIAAEAAAQVMEIYALPFEVDFKAPSDPITEADRVANEFICARLREEYPDIPIVAEESPPEEWASFRKSERIFFVDPVDGTREFVARTGQFATMIGLVDGEEPTHGVLHAPAQRKIWAAAVGQGAFRIDEGGSEQRLSALRDKKISDATVVSSRSQRTELNKNALDLLQAKKIIPMGSAGLKGMAVADGEADIYLAPQFAGCLWDSCAPEAVIRALGGQFTDVQGQRINYRAGTMENNRGAIAAAPQLHNEVVRRLSLLFR